MKNNNNYELARVLILLAPLPCLMMSVAGIMCAVKAAKEGVMHSRKYIVIGIIEIIVYVAVAILACTIFIAGQSV